MSRGCAGGSFVTRADLGMRLVHMNLREHAYFE